MNNNTATSMCNTTKNRAINATSLNSHFGDTELTNVNQFAFISVNNM
ncbi:hypothetical protein ACR30L_06970 [Psychromonas sp. PT13]